MLIYFYFFSFSEWTTHEEVCLTFLNLNYENNIFYKLSTVKQFANSHNFDDYVKIWTLNGYKNKLFLYILNIFTYL